MFPLPTGKSTSFGDKSRNDHDWALLDNLPPAIESRANRQTTRVHNISIREISPSGACRSVVINVPGIGRRQGFLHSSPVMKVDLSILEVQLITLERALHRSHSHSPRNATTKPLWL
ncbi:hypothetical protein XPA_010400 [Xanthoria parietina]